jgi:hypothetical protein
VGPERDDVVEKRKKSMVRISVWLTLGGAVFAFAPILLASILDSFSEDIAALMVYLAFYTLPLGAIIVLVGLVLLVVSLIRRRGEPDS